MKKIQALVEGHGEVQALPVLLRRLRDAGGAFDLDFYPPIRTGRAQLVSEATLRELVRRALSLRPCNGLLILFDGDDDCPKDLVSQIQAWARAEAGAVPCEVVIAQREYEAWLFSVLDPAQWPRDPESVRDAKGRLRRDYAATLHQARLTARFDLAAAYRSCRSFRRMVRAFGLLAEGAGSPLADWPPDSWRVPS
jgi:hypothetical protein